MKLAEVENISALVAQVIRDALAQSQAEEAAPAEPSLLTARDVAARLQTNVQAVYRLARDGRLSPDVVLGPRTYRWTEHTVAAFIERGGVAAPAAANVLRLVGSRA